MTAPKRRFDLTFPWHVIVAPALPVLALIAPNVSELSARGALWPIVIGISAALLIWGVVSWVVGDARTSALGVTVFAVATLSFANVARVAIQFGVPPIALYFVVLVICFVLLHASRIALQTTVFANVLVLITAAVFGLQIVSTEVGRTRASVSPLPGTSTLAGQRPDIYVLILDGYGRADVIRDLYGFENDLENQLTALGFFVAREAHSNYAQTTQSLASSLNMDYLAPLLHDLPESARNRRALADLINDNRLFRMLRTGGYRITSYDSEYDLIRPTADRTLGPWFQATHFAFSFYEGTALPGLLRMLGRPPSELPLHAHRRSVRWVLDHLEEGAGDVDEVPTVVFAHLLIPHPPFVFNPNGSDRSTNLAAAIFDGDHWQMAAAGRGERYAAGYVDSLRFLNTRLVGIARMLLSRRRPTVIYMHGDHGPGSRLQWENAVASDLRERFGILMAMRFHDGDHSTLSHRLSPVNASRALVNHALGTALPALEDRSYFATWSRPFELIDVTDRVEAKP